MNADTNNVVGIFDRRPILPGTFPAKDEEEAARCPDDILSAYAELAEDDARSAATLMTPGLGVARKSRHDLIRMVSTDLDDATEALSAFRDGAASAFMLYETLQAAETKLALAIRAVSHQQRRGA